MRIEEEQSKSIADGKSPYLQGWLKRKNWAIKIIDW